MTLRDQRQKEFADMWLNHERFIKHLEKNL